MNIQSISELDNYPHNLSTNNDVYIELAYNNNSYKGNLKDIINYIIAINTNLQNQINLLTGRVSTLETNSNALSGNFGSYLPISGGILTGPLFINTNNNPPFNIVNIISVQQTRVDLANNIKLYGVATSAQWC